MREHDDTEHQGASGLHDAGASGFCKIESGHKAHNNL